MIDQYAKNYSMDPDVVYQKDFDTVLNFLRLWKEQGDYFDRYRVIEKKMEPNQ